MKQQLFDDIYNETLFNSQLGKFMYRRGNHWAKRIEKVFDIVSKLEPLGNKVLDLGTSVGTFAYEFATRGYDVTAVDLSEKAISIAKEIAKVYKKSIKYVTGDVTHRNNFSSKEFDIIYAGDIIEHLLDDALVKTLENCFYWSKPGGYFIFHTVPTKYNIIFHKSPLWILLLLFAIFPDRFFKKIVELLFIFFNFSVKIITGKSYVERERQTLHCNLQTKEKILHILKMAGFEILNIELTITEERFLRGFKNYFFKNKEYFQKDMFGVAYKPFEFTLYRQRSVI